MSSSTETDRRVMKGEMFWCKSPTKGDGDSRGGILQVSRDMTSCVLGTCLDSETGQFHHSSMINKSFIAFDREVTAGELEQAFEKAREELARIHKDSVRILEDTIGKFTPSPQED